MKDKLTKENYFKYHTFYCGVSGSPIDPERKDRYDYVKVNISIKKNILENIIVVVGHAFVT